MGLGAIVVLGAELGESSSAQRASSHDFISDPLTCIDILGRSMLERTIEKFVQAGVTHVSVLVPTELSHAIRPFSIDFDNVVTQIVANVSAGIVEQLSDYANSGIDHAFVTSASLYTEGDLLDLFYFHREARQAATRAYDCQLPLQLWVVDCARAQDCSLHSLLTKAQGPGPAYLIRDYVTRTLHARDVRRFVSDALKGRCAARPSGVETKPGIWLEEGVEIHRRARVVSPAFLGRGSKVMEDTLVTRCSSLETGCCVDYGTAIEDSSILAKTHVGIWLDVCHAVGSGNKLFNLERNVILEIADASIMRSNSTVRHAVTSSVAAEHERLVVAADLRRQKEEKKTPAPDRWQFGANPIRG